MAKQEFDFKKWYESEKDELSQDPEFIAQGIMMDLSIQIADYLKQHNLKQKDLADRLGKSQGWVSRFLNGPTNFSVLKLTEMAVALGLKLNVSFEINDQDNKEYQPVSDNSALVADPSHPSEKEVEN